LGGIRANENSAYSIFIRENLQNLTGGGFENNQRDKTRRGRVWTSKGEGAALKNGGWKKKA